MFNNIDKNNPFKVPENYFQNLNTEIMSMLPEKKKKAVPLWRSITKWSAVAAVTIGVAAVGLNHLNENSKAINANITQNENIQKNEQSASLQNDYFLFLEDETTQMAYKDSFY